MGFVVLVFLVVANIVLVRGVRFAVLQALGVTEARVFGHEEPFLVRPRRRALVAASMVVAGYLLAAAFAGLAFAAEGRGVPQKEIEVLRGSVAETAGLVTGDRVTRVGGERAATIDEVRAVLARNGDAAIAVEVDRAGTPLSFMLTPRDAKIGIRATYARAGLLDDIRVGLTLPLEVVRGVALVLAPRSHAQSLGVVGLTSAVSSSPSPTSMFALYFYAVAAWETFALLPLFAIGAWAASARVRRG